MNTLDSIGARIKAARLKKGYTMKQLHEITGLSTGNISCLENNHYAPSVSALVPLKEALGCSIDWLLSGEDIQKSESGLQDDECQLCDEETNTQMERELVSMFRILNEHDRDNVFDFVTMLYEKTTGKRASISSTYTEDERRQTNKSIPSDTVQDGIA